MAKLFVSCFASGSAFVVFQDEHLKKVLTGGKTIGTKKKTIGKLGEKPMIVSP